MLKKLNFSLQNASWLIGYLCMLEVNTSLDHTAPYNWDSLVMTWQNS